MRQLHVYYAYGLFGGTEVIVTWSLAMAYSIAEYYFSGPVMVYTEGD